MCARLLTSDRVGQGMRSGRDDERHRDGREPQPAPARSCDVGARLLVIRSSVRETFPGVRSTVTGSAQAASVTSGSWTIGEVAARACACDMRQVAAVRIEPTGQLSCVWPGPLRGCRVSLVSLPCDALLLASSPAGARPRSSAARQRRSAAS
jgi:hypothetical protein